MTKTNITQALLSGAILASAATTIAAPNSQLSVAEGASEKVMTSLKSLLNNREDEIRWRSNLIKLIEDKRFKTKY